MPDFPLEDNQFTPETDSSFKEKSNHGVRRPTTEDERFWKSLEHLKKCRDLLSIHEENYINNMADRYKHLR